MSMLSKKYFHNEAAAFDHLEKILWSDGVVCPKCGTVDRAGKLKGEATRPGLWKCYSCRKQFTCTVGTVFESRHIPLHKMLQAVYLLTASKKGCSSHQLHRTLEITYKSAWFLAHRIREAMRTGALGPLGGEGMFVEADETFKIAGHMESADVAGPGGNNALPAVMQVQFITDAAFEAGGLADVNGVPVSVDGELAEDVDAGALIVLRADQMELEVVFPPARARPYH